MKNLSIPYKLVLDLLSPKLWISIKFNSESVYNYDWLNLPSINFASESPYLVGKSKHFPSAIIFSSLKALWHVRLGRKSYFLAIFRIFPLISGILHQKNSRLIDIVEIQYAVMTYSVHLRTNPSKVNNLSVLLKNPEFCRIVSLRVIC